MVVNIGEGSRAGAKKIVAPVLGKYFRPDYLIDIVYRNGGILPGGSGNIMSPVFFGCGINQEEFLQLLTFYGGYMLLAKKDPLEAEQVLEEIGQNLLDNYKLDDEEIVWLNEKFINKKNKPKENENKTK